MDGLRRLLPRTAKSADSLRDWFRWNRELIRACATYNPEIVLATDFDTLLAGYSIMRRTGCVVLYDAHELWPDMHNRMHLTRSFRRLFLMLEGFLIRRADLRFTVSQGLARVLAERYSIEQPLVVFNGPDEIRSPQPSGTRKLAVYFQGLFQTGRGIEEAIEAMALVRGRATLTFQGYGELETYIKKRATELDLFDGTVAILPPCPPEEVSRRASMYDVGLISVEPLCLNNVLSMPNKVFSYLGGSLSLMTTDEAPEIAATVRDHGCGVVIERWSAELIAEALLDLANRPEDVARMRQNAHQAAQMFAWDLQFEPVLEWLAAELQHPCSSTGSESTR